MGKFISVKIVEANFMPGDFAAEFGYKVADDDLDKIGYEIVYHNGYKSWIPADEFEKAYFPLECDNKINSIDVERFIATEDVSTIENKTTLVSIKTVTGYECCGRSSCANSKKYNQELGAYHARNKAKDIIRASLEFVLQWAINGVKFVKPKEDTEDNID